jgi:acyl carrier protein phosphodiesterase
MNYLAHAYLSFNQPEILVGNMISDFVKGKKKFDYADIIQKGITLHRAIDEFTDVHNATKQAKSFFKKDYGLYAGAFVDVVYDHFLANDANEFTKETLKKFSLHVYQQLSVYEEYFPEKFKRMFYYMQADDWLYNYQFKQNIYKSFGGLVRRALYMHDHQTAYNIFENNYAELKLCYETFFPLVKNFAFEKMNSLLLQ